MQRYFIAVAMLILSFAAAAQHTIKTTIKNKDTGEPLIGATVSIESLKKVTAADSSGLAIIKEIPTGKYLVKISFVGYASKEETVDISNDVELTIEMEPELKSLQK